MIMEEVPLTDAHSPEELRKEMLMCGSVSMSLVFPIRCSCGR